ncbi:uncharacterized protein CEXT_30621 [Caerostris extrusa]|uniref:Uncharacterized protein n=1 Tax=Caerostris extrusa TaxID=172846 RepID=A0AAV4S0C7_CAEEX|nr:uncharacterized protein CEXT_30621 [Caerostris extrusa]
MTNSKALNMLGLLMLSRNRITTLGSSLQKLVRLELLKLDSNRLRTLAKEQIPANLLHLHLADNPFHCDCQMLLFLNHLNSTDNPVVDVPVCTPPNDTTPIPPPSNCPPGCRCFCTHDAQRHFMSVDCSSLGLTRLPALFSSANGSFATEKWLTVLFVLISGDGLDILVKNEKTIWTNLEIQDEIAGLDVTNNSLQSMEEARLPEGMVHLFLANNQFRVPPTALLNSQEKSQQGHAVRKPLGLRLRHHQLQKWILSSLTS